jgi:integrase
VFCSNKTDQLVRATDPSRCRASEVGLLHKEDLDLKALRLVLHRLKGSHSGTHPLQPDEVKAVKLYLRSRLDWLMKEYGKAAGISESKRHFHVLKHSIATRGSQVCSRLARPR